MLAVNSAGDDQQHNFCEGRPKEVIMPLAGGCSKDYSDWWRAQAAVQNDSSLFSVRLIGDASSPQCFTSMAPNDLAYCRHACCSLYVRPLQHLHSDFVTQCECLCAASGVTTELWSTKRKECQSP